MRTEGVDHTYLTGGFDVYLSSAFNRDVFPRIWRHLRACDIPLSKVMDADPCRYVFLMATTSHSFQDIDLIKRGYSSNMTTENNQQEKQKLLSYGVPAFLPLWASTNMLSRLGGDIVVITVGRPNHIDPSNPKSFVVHREVVRTSSDVLKRAFDEPARQNKTKDLPNEQPDYFSIYLNWLYRDRIMTQERGNFFDDEDAEYIELAELYSLGTNLEDIKFKNAVIDSILTKWKATPSNLPGAAFIRTVFTPGSVTSDKGLAKLVVKMYAETATPSRMEEIRGQLPENFLQDLIMELLGMYGERGDSHSFMPSSFYEPVGLGPSPQAESLGTQRSNLEAAGQISSVMRSPSPGWNSD